MIVRNDLVTGSTAELKHALEAAGHDRSKQVDEALAGVERILGQRLLEFTAPVEPDTDHEWALLPSPGIERRARGLRQDLADILGKVRALRAEVASETESRAGSVSDRLQELVVTLERHEHGEIDLVQKGMTPDIGAGD
jgi:hypothetical protein